MKFIGRCSSRVVLPLFGAALAVGTMGSPGSAQDLPEFRFDDCPAIPAGHQAVGSLCFNAVVVGGRLQIGSFDQEISEPIRLTWGSFRNATNPFTPPKIVFGRFHAPRMVVLPDLGGEPVFARPRFARVFDQPPSADTRVVLGLKIKLINPLLGETCFLGSNSDPMVLNLTTGTTNPPPPNQPISGVSATIVQTDPFTVRSATHVDNAFSVPGATGCGELNDAVNLVAGTPSPAGTNTVVQQEFIGSRSYTEL